MIFENLKLSTPDALCIMMNPGTSTPLKSFYKERIHEVESFKINHQNKPLVLTIPDDTQFRIMAIMKAKGWKHVRVINLTDIRQHESEKLKLEINSFNQVYPIPIHSLFSKKRKKELFEILSSVKSKPIIMAWGTQKCLKEFANICFQMTNNFSCYGVTSKQDELFLQHPLTSNCSWVDEILTKINSNITLDNLYLSTNSSNKLK